MPPGAGTIPQTPLFAGSNTLLLNEATMIAIVQYWIRNQMINKDMCCPIVFSVKQTVRGAHNEFEIMLQEESLT